MRYGLEIFLTFTEVTEEKPLCGTFCPPSPQNNNNNNDDDNMTNVTQDWPYNLPERYQGLPKNCWIIFIGSLGSSL